MAGHIAGALPPNPYLLFLSWCPSFLPLMEEKKQKKIKASPRPGMFGRVYCGGVAPEPLPPFLVLTQEKEAKESQGLTEAGDVWPGI